MFEKMNTSQTFNALTMFPEACLDSSFYQSKDANVINNITLLTWSTIDLIEIRFRG